MASDPLSFFEKMKKLAAENEELKEELEDIDLILAQMVITDVNYKFWVKMGEGQYDYGEGETENPSFVMSANQVTMEGIRKGDIDGTSAYMSGDLQIEGNLQDAITYGDVIGLAGELMEEE